MKSLFDKLTELLGDDLLFGQMPDSPHDLIIANIYAGNSPTYAIDELLPMIREVGVQLMARGLDYIECVTKLDSHMNTLQSYYGDLDDTYYVMSVSQTSDILPLGRDKQNRYLFSINMTVKLHRR